MNRNKPITRRQLLGRTSAVGGGLLLSELALGAVARDAWALADEASQSKELASAMPRRVLGKTGERCVMARDFYTADGIKNTVIEPGEIVVRVAVPLVPDGDLWRGDTPTRTRPADGPYLRCSDADWQLRCGIESWFLPQDKAIALERAVSSGSAVARVRVDGRGNAALVGVEVSGAG